MDIGWLRGGRLAGLARTSLRALPLLIVGVVLVAAAPLPIAAAVPAGLLIGAGYLAALGALWANRDQPYLWLAAVGAALNAAVIVASGGRMPVAQEAVERAGRPVGGTLLAGTDPRHVLAGPGSPLAALGDRWAVHVGALGLVLSPGDVVLAAAVACFVQAAMLGRGSPVASS
jgi:hypothetical protein